MNILMNKYIQTNTLKCLKPCKNEGKQFQLSNKNHRSGSIHAPESGAHLKLICLNVTEDRLSVLCPLQPLAKQNQYYQFTTSIRSLTGFDSSLNV